MDTKTAVLRAAVESRAFTGEDGRLWYPWAKVVGPRYKPTGACMEHPWLERTDALVMVCHSERLPTGEVTPGREKDAELVEVWNWRVGGPNHDHYPGIYCYTFDVEES